MEFDRVPRIAKYLSVVFLLAWLGRSTVWHFLPIYFEKHIASVFLIGVITSLPAAIPLLLDIPAGNLIQRTGEKIVIFVGLISQIFPPILYASTLPVLMVFGKASEGFAKAMIWNGGWSVSLRSADEDVESESISVFLLGVNLALIVGPVIGGYLVASRGFPITFKLWVITSILSVAVFYSYIGIKRRKGLAESVETLFHRKTYLDDWHHIKDNWEALRFPFVLIFLHSIIFSFYWLALPLLLNDIAPGDFELMGLIFGAAAVPKAFQFVFGDFADRIGKLKTLSVLAGFLTPVMVALSFVSELVIVGVLFFVARLLSSGMSPAAHAVFDHRAPDEIESELTGFLEFFKHAGQTIGPVMAGTIASIWSINASFLAAASVAGIIFVLSLARALN